MHKSIVRAAPQRGFYRERDGLPYYSGAQDIEGEDNYIDLRQETIPPPFVLPTKAHSVHSHSHVRQPASGISERALSESKPPFVPPPSPLEKLKTKVKHLERDKANLQIQMRLLREDYEEKLWHLRQELGAVRTENKSLQKRTAELEGQLGGDYKSKGPEQMQDIWYSQNPLFMTPGRILYHHGNPVVERQADTNSESSTSTSIRSGGPSPFYPDKDLKLIEPRSLASRSAKTSVWTPSSTPPSQGLTPSPRQSRTKQWSHEESPCQSKGSPGQGIPEDRGGDEDNRNRKGKSPCYVYNSAPRVGRARNPNRRRRHRNNWFRDWLYPEQAEVDPDEKQIPTQTPSPPPSMIIP